MNVAPAAAPGSMFNERNSVSDGVYGAAHRRQTFRTNRWAIRARVEDATRNGLTRMSIKRVTALGASLVWSVENTRWPVSEALIAMVAVSTSRISPSMMMFGAWRRIERRAIEKLSPTASLTCTWLMPASWYSTGSSTVIILRSGRLMKWRQE